MLTSLVDSKNVSMSSRQGGSPPHSESRPVRGLDPAGNEGRPSIYRVRVLNRLGAKDRVAIPLATTSPTSSVLTTKFVWCRVTRRPGSVRVVCSTTRPTEDSAVHSIVIRAGKEMNGKGNNRWKNSTTIACILFATLFDIKVIV